MQDGGWQIPGVAAVRREPHAARHVVDRIEVTDDPLVTQHVELEPDDVSLELQRAIEIADPRGNMAELGRNTRSLCHGAEQE